MRVVVLALLVLATSPPVVSAPLATLREQDDGRVITTQLRTEGARVIANRAGRDVWTLAVEPSGPRLTSTSTSEVPCDAALAATLELDDRNGDGRIDQATGERARLFASASWRSGNAWRSAVLAIEIGATGRARVAWEQDSTALGALGRDVPAPVRIRLGAGGPERVLVAAGWPRDPLADALTSGGELLMFDAESGATLPSPFRSRASLTSGIAAIDLEGDGATDRLYLADAAWQVWRIDLTGGRFDARRLADLSARREAGAAFAFAPDVALEGQDRSKRLDVTLGTSDAPARRAARHWLFVLRDPFEADPAGPISVADLLAVDATTPSSVADGVRGLLLALPGPLAAPVLTVAGALVIATHAVVIDRCALHVEEAAPVQVSLLGAETGTFELRSTRVAVEPGSRLSLDWQGAGTDARLGCFIGSQAVPLCPELPLVTRDYWVRKDAP